MFKGWIHKPLSKSRRLRLKAGTLALVFAVYALLPWLHVMTASSDPAGHGCCHPISSAASDRSAPVALAVQAADASDTCWVCQSLLSLLQHNARSEAATLISFPPSSSSVARAPHAPALLQIFPASRAQAPPARA